MVRSCDDGYPSCRQAEAGGEWCEGKCKAVRRDPRDNPQPGDEVRQYSGPTLRVTYRDDDTVAWQTWKRDGWMSDNAWTLRGWTEVVCNRSIVVKVADA